LKRIGILEYQLVEYQPSQLELIIGFLVNPMVSGLLLMVIIGGIYFELQTPGIGFPLAASVIAAILYFSPLYLEGLANHYEIFMFIIGLVLIGVELFVIPGFGVPGILGILMAITGLALSMVDNIGFDFTFTHGDELIQAFIIVFSALIGSLIISVYIGSRLLKTPLFDHLVLKTTQPANKGYTGVDQNKKHLVGKEGIAATILRPSGKVEINEAIYDATAEIGFIEKGEPIKVIRFETTQLFVRKVNP
jgi:membrane-bound serine protease (ClpP class)